jgi:cytochrome c551/c552
VQKRKIIPIYIDLAAYYARERELLTKLLAMSRRLEKGAWKVLILDNYNDFSKNPINLVKCL